MDAQPPAPRRAHPSAAQLLAICAYLAPEAIPLILINSAALPAPLGPAADGAVSLSHVVGVLTDYSLAKRDQDTITVHRLVQLATRGHASSAMVSDERHPLAQAIGLLHHYLPAEVFNNPSTWPRWRRLLPHVLAALHHHATTPDLTPEIAAWLLDRTGIYLHSTGLVGQARPFLERAIAIDEATHSSDHLMVATNLSNLALVLQDLGRPAEAKPLLERALAIDEATYGADHPSVAISLGNLAGVLHALGQPADAGPLLERAERIRAGRQHQNPNSADASA